MHEAQRPEARQVQALAPSVAAATAGPALPLSPAAVAPGSLAATEREQLQAPATSLTAPVDVSPPYPRTAAAEDGHWQAFSLNNGAEASVQSPPLFWRTRLHPHPKTAYIVVDVIAFDLKRVKLEWVIGTGDTGNQRLTPFMSPGLTADADSVVAVFNGGFMARHGWWGQQSHGQVLVPPKANGCGVALLDDGSVRLGHYAEVAAEPQLVSYRQTPPCLVEAGKLHSNLERGEDRAWAGKNDALATRRRSALGISADGQTLYYLLGTETGALDLARALITLGVSTGLQLDINWNWTRFFLVGPDAKGHPSAQQPLLDSMVHDYGEYFTRPSQRDFFVVRRR